MTLPDAVDPKPRYLRLSVALATIILSLFAIDRLLARIEDAEIQREAKAQFDAGTNRLREGDKPAALAALQRAHALSRSNGDYSLGLAEALLANGKYDDAAVKLHDILAADSNNGKANLLMARLLGEQSNVNETIAFYHRAVYGTWAGGGEERAKVRLELADYLAGSHRRQELSSELLLLQDPAEKDPAMATRVAHLFLVAGSGPRAATMYGVVLRYKPGDEKALQGLAEANLLSGDYRGAESTFLLALRSHPADADLVHRLHFANTLATLDPTYRRLSSQAKFERSAALLASVRSGLSECPQAAGSPLATETDSLLSAKIPRSPTNEDAEGRLTLAEKLWQMRREACPDQLGKDEATEIIMRKLQDTK